MGGLLWLILAILVVLAPVAPRVVALGLSLVAVRHLRLHPRKTIDITWSHLLAALWYLLFPSGETHSAIEADIGRLWAPKDPGSSLVFLSVRTGIDLVLGALQLPKGSEVLFWPGITIPAVVEIVESHGLRARGADPKTAADFQMEDLDKHLGPDTKVLVIMHLFGTILDPKDVIRIAKGRGIFVMEDCAQAFVGAAKHLERAAQQHYGDGFRGHEEVDASFVSFGIMKSMTALGGAVGCIRDEKVRERVKAVQQSFAVRPTSQFVAVLLKACILRIILRPSLWGLLAAVCATFRINLDKLIISAVRGFPNKVAFRMRPALPLLQLLRRRLRAQHDASFGRGATASSTASPLALRRVVGERIARRLQDAGVEVVASDAGVTTWWLMPLVDDQPAELARGLWRRGFDATCISTQLAAVSSVAATSPKAADGAGGHSHQVAAEIMSRIVYLPLTAEMPLHAADALVDAVVEVRRERQAKVQAAAKPVARSSMIYSQEGAQQWLTVLLLALALARRPLVVLWWLPSRWFLCKLAGLVATAGAVMVLIGRRFAVASDLHVTPETLKALAPKPRRLSGAAFCRSSQLLPEARRFDGAVVLTGATGFVGGATLFYLLARAEELGITRIVCIVRKRPGSTATDRLDELRTSSTFEEVRDVFDRLVVVLEGDVAQQDLGWAERHRKWPYAEPLKAVLHCAADVRFDLPLSQAAVSSITASLQVAQLAALWGSPLFLFVSTAFVHAVPSTVGSLREELVELRDFDPMELYRDIVGDGRWATKAMRELGFPNTYTFTKAIAEHLVLRACADAGLDVRIVRPSIVGPAWAAPYAGWCGQRPSTIVAVATLIHQRVIRAFPSAPSALPVVPVDLVAEATIATMIAPPRGPGTAPFVVNAAIDTSEAHKLPTTRWLMALLFQLLALSGDMPLLEAGLLARVSAWSHSEPWFWSLHTVLNVFPCEVVRLVSACLERVAAWCPCLLHRGTWSSRHALARKLSRFSALPAQYAPFSCPRYPWAFSSAMRLPTDWDPLEYALLIGRTGLSFSLLEPQAWSASALQAQAAVAFQEVRISPPSSALLDVVLTLGTPGVPLFICAAGFVVRRAFRWMKLSVSVDAASLVSVTGLAMPLVMCPTHRSLLDFVIIGTTCFQLHPILPALQLPHVAADAEFSGLPVLSRILVALGAFFVRRGGGKVQPDPALRAEVGRVFRNGQPIEVFLEGLRSRGRRHLRLRSGFLRTLQSVAHRNVALLPVAISYELLPEDEPFYEELRGCPRKPLQTLALVKWTLRGLRGELPSYGAAHVKLGCPRVLDSDSDLEALLHDLQQQLVQLTVLTELHARALAELLNVSPAAVAAVLKASTGTLRRSHVHSARGLLDAERWALVIQAAAALRHQLPPQWASWVVEPLRIEAAPIGGEAPAPVSALSAEVLTLDEDEEEEEETEHHHEVPRGADADGDVIARLTALLQQAETAAQEVAVALRRGGVLQFTEEHLRQQLLQSNGANPGLPPPLAVGAARIVARQLRLVSRDSFPELPKGPEVVPLWPNGVQRRSDEPAVDRWGYKDTKFVAQWVDGRPAVHVTSQRYKSLSERPMFELWSFWEECLAVKMSVRETIPERLPEVPPPAKGLEERLAKALQKDMISMDAESRLRAGTGHGLEDIWRLRSGEVHRLPDAVVRPKTEEEVSALLQEASAGNFAIIPVGGRTNVTSATVCPSRDVDPRPFVALDMRGLAAVLWVNKEDNLSCVQAGITGAALQQDLRNYGVTMGMEPDSMEFSTLGGWIATRASGMKRTRYGNIEDMVVEVRVVTPSGTLWQRRGKPSAATAVGRSSSGVELPGLVLGSEGCLGIITAAVVRVHPLPKVVEYQSVVFPGWDHGASWMREVGRLPQGLRPASCRLMDNKQLRLAMAIRPEPSKKKPLRAAAQDMLLRLKGIHLHREAAAATLVFEGTRDEVEVQKRSVRQLVRRADGLWAGASSGEAGYTMTYAIAYLRDFGLDHKILSESLETMVPWSQVRKVWPAVVAAVTSEHHALRLPGQPFVSCRMTQLYDEGAVLYMYIATCTAGFAPSRALEAFNRLEMAARRAILREGGCLSHHHGVGKHRASMVKATQSPELVSAMRAIKAAFDPENVLGAGNGVWARGAPDHEGSASSEEEDDVVEF